MTTPNAWLPSLSSERTAHVRLFCFPHAGGGSAVYHGWKRRLPPQIEVVPVKLPGREDRFGEPACDDLRHLVAGLVPAVCPAICGEFALFGHSMGALIAFELGRRLQSQHGLSPSQLFVSACRAPQLIRTAEDHLHQLPEEAMIEAIVRDFGTGQPPAADELTLMRFMSSTIRADLKLLETYAYQPGPPLSCPLVALSATEDHQISRADVSAWQQHTTGSFTMRVFPGHHFFLRDQQAAVTQLIAARLLRAP